VNERSVAAITTKASMIVEWKPLRSGRRRVTGLELRMALDLQGQLDMGTDDLEE
jgi:hypothetical protein